MIIIDVLSDIIDLKKEEIKSDEKEERDKFDIKRITRLQAINIHGEIVEIY